MDLHELLKYQEREGKQLGKPCEGSSNNVVVHGLGTWEQGGGSGEGKTTVM